MNEIVNLLAVGPEYLYSFSYNPDYITISAKQFQAPLLELFSRSKLPRQLRCAEDVYAACTVVYAVSQDSSEPQEQHDVLEKAAKLSMSVFDQRLQKLPITFVSAFTVVISKLAELKSEADKALIEVSLNNIQVQNDEQARYIISNFLMQLLNRSYHALSLNSLFFIVDFLAKENEQFKLIEVVCLGYCGNFMRKVEEEVAMRGYYELYKRIEEEDDILPLVHQFVVYIAASGHYDYVIERFFADFLLKYAENDAHNIVAGLLCSSYQIIGVKVASQLISTAKVNHKQLVFIAENIIVHFKGCDDQYLSAVCQLVEYCVRKDEGITIEQLTYTADKNHSQAIILLTVLPTLVLLCSKRLATHLKQISATIATRRFIVDFYGKMLLWKHIVHQLEQAVALPSYTEAMMKLLYSVKCQNEYVQRLLEKYYKILHEHIVIPVGELLLQELKFRLQDESQMVKKTALARLTDFLASTPEQVDILFTDMLLIYDQPQLAYQSFAQFVLQPLEQGDVSFLYHLFAYLEQCPIKLYESTFAAFLKDYKFAMKDAVFLIEQNSKGAYIVLKMVIYYSQLQSDKNYARLVDILHVRLIDGFYSGKEQYLYVLYCLNTPQLRYCVKFNLLEFASADLYNDDEFYFGQLIVDYEVSEVTDFAKYFADLSKILSNLLPEYHKAYDSQDKAQLEVYFAKGNAVYRRIIASIYYKASVSQNTLKKLLLPLEAQLFYHPCASIVYYYLLYASDNLEFRLELFEKMINTLSNITTMNAVDGIHQAVANNTLMAAFSAIYQYPDELGQFTSLLLDNDCIENNFLLQRHILYVIMDLHYLSLIKIDYYLFNSMFRLLLSSNEDLRALTERLLLSPKFNSYFVKFFRLCMNELYEQSKTARYEIYIKIIYKLDQVSKYYLLNYFLYTLPTSSPTEALDLFTLIYSGAVSLNITEEYEKAASILRRLNTQYTIQSVIPRLMERLSHYNAQQATELYFECIKALQAVCQQMHVEYEELIAYFGSEYCLELLQVKW